MVCRKHSKNILFVVEDYFQLLINALVVLKLSCGMRNIYLMTYMESIHAIQPKSVSHMYNMTQQN